jgi:hypothetical protein
MGEREWMGRPRTLPDKDDLRRLLDTHTQTEVAAMFGVSRAAVSSMVQRYDIAPPKERYDDVIPWRVKVVHQRAFPLRMLRLYARRLRGKHLDSREERYLDAFLDKLKEMNAVVGYDAALPEGFFYTDPRPGVDTGLIRVPPWLIEEPAPKRRRKTA